MELVTRLRDWYGRFERHISSVALLGGFIIDSLTLQRVDLFWNNFLVLVHLVVVATCIILINLQKNDEIADEKQTKMHFWLINIMQFSFGGLLSIFLVFYFRSATLSATWPFLLLLLGAFIANELLKKHYQWMTFQISFFYLSILSFAIFIVPVFFHRIGTDIFIISGLFSLLVLWIFILVLKFYAKEKFLNNKKYLIISVSLIFILTNILYFFNLIPPIPLSLKDSGVYHSIFRNATGDYVVLAENVGWRRYLSLHETFHKVAGEPVYVFSAIFSPTSFNTGVIHEWQKYDFKNREWDTVNQVRLASSGGRDEGYRTYSMKNDISVGEWRVNVKTIQGQIISRVRFDVAETKTMPNLKNEIK